MTKLQSIHPVLPSANIERDIKWYKEKLGFIAISFNEGYAVLNRDHLFIHLQWHAGTTEDPLLGGSVIKLFVDDIHPIFNEFIKRESIQKKLLRLNTPWNTNEFGLYDPNKNAIFVVESLS